MPVSYVTSYSGTSSSSGNSVVASSVTANADDLLVVGVASDNSSSSAPTITVADSASNTWTLIGNTFAAASGTGNAGTVLYVYYSYVTNAISGGTVTGTLSGNRTAKVIRVMRFTGVLKEERNTEVMGGSTTASTSVTVTSNSGNAGDLMIAFAAIEYGTTLSVTYDSDTTNGSWASGQTVSIGSTASGQSLACQYKIPTAAATQTWNLTTTSARRSYLIVPLKAGSNTSGTQTVTATLDGTAGKTLDTSGDLAITTAHSSTVTGGGYLDVADEREHFDLGTNGNTIGNTDDLLDGGSTGAGSTITYSNEHYITPPLSAKFDAGDGDAAGYRDLVITAGAQTVGHLSFYLWCVDTGNPSAKLPIVLARTVINNNSARLCIRTNGNIGLDDGNTGTGSDYAFPRNEWVRLEWKLDHTANTQTLRFYHGANLHGLDTPDAEVSGTLVDQEEVYRFRFGHTAALTSGFTLFYDEIGYRVADWAGPATQESPIKNTSGSLEVTAARDSTVTGGQEPYVAPALVQSKLGTSIASTTSCTATFDTGATAGNLLWAAIAIDKTSGTVTPPSGFSTAFVSDSTSVSMWVGYKVATGGETAIQVQWATTSPTGTYLWIGEYSSGMSGDWGIAASASNYTNESNVTSWASGTTGSATYTGRALAFFAIDSGDSATTNPSYTNSYSAQQPWARANGRGDIAVATLAQVNAGATTSTTASWSGSDQVSGAVVVFNRHPVGATQDTDGSLAVTSSQSGTAVYVTSTSGTLAATETPSSTPVRGALTSGTTAVTGSVTSTLNKPQGTSGTISVTETPTGTTSHTAPTSGTTSVTAGLSGTAAKIQDTSGSLSVTASTSGTATHLAPTSGTLGVSAGAIGTAELAPKATDGSLSVSAGLSGTSTHTAPVSGSMALTGAFTGTSSTVGLTSGSLAVTETPSGTTSRVVSTSGTLAVTAGTTGPATALHPTSGDRAVTAGTTGTTSHAAPTSGTTSVTATLSGTASKAGADTSGSLSITSSTSGTTSHVAPTTGTLAVTADRDSSVDVVNADNANVHPATVHAHAYVSISDPILNRPYGVQNVVVK